MKDREPTSDQYAGTFIIPWLFGQPRKAVKEECTLTSLLCVMTAIRRVLRFELVDHYPNHYKQHFEFHSSENLIMASPKPDIVLYTSGTPNGQKASITLEELGLPYRVENIQISKNTQKEKWYLKINPNGRIPAMVDRTPGADGKPREKRIFESGAMMLYLCQRYDPEQKLSYELDSDLYWEVVEWLVWMQSGLGPMQVRRVAIQGLEADMLMQ